MGKDNSLKSYIGSLVQAWVQSWLSCIDLPPLPLKRSPLTRSPLTRSEVDDPFSPYPIVYQSALFPWLAGVLPKLGDADVWEVEISTLLPQWQKQQQQDSPQDFKTIELEIVPRHGLKIGVAGTPIVTILRRWLDASSDLPTLPPSLHSPLRAKTGDGCELQYHSDRCRQLQALAQRQGWLPHPPPWNGLTWETGFQNLWHTDPTGRSLLEAWIDQTDALDQTPHHLVTHTPQFLKQLTQYDRAQTWRGLAHSLPQSQFWGRCALLTASDRLLDRLKL